ncbi:hypothetical protein Csa_018589 [Cucumis sativus]|uniref:Uncharacterized protein n=1 Tax=Cucumis sativus TaxID=3659 RepID=A0A0A0KTE9_CUCSA|nr:hypothetical protein Csa_018589 [Cucumis sativus]
MDSKTEWAGAFVFGAKVGAAHGAVKRILTRHPGAKSEEQKSMPPIIRDRDDYPLRNIA